MTSLYEIGSLPDSFLKDRYDVTKGYYEDPLTMENFQKEAIKYNGCEKPLFEEEMPRVNSVHRSNVLSLMENGSRYTHAPFHPELFLGDVTPDDRGVHTEPIAAKLTEQNRYRQKYIKMQNDDTNNVIEGVVDQKLMSQKVKQGLNNTAARYGGIFDESQDSAHYRAPNAPGNLIDSELAIREDQKFYESGGEKIIAQLGKSKVNAVSNLIGAQWHVQPDTKFKISSVSNLYRTKAEVDNSVSAVFKLARQDQEFKKETSDGPKKQMGQALDSIRKDKFNQMTVNVSLDADSKKNAAPNRVDRMLGHKGGKEILLTKQTQLKKFEKYINQRYHKRHDPNAQRMAQGKRSEKFKTRNDETNNQNCAMPVKDKLKIVRSIVNDNKKKYQDKFSSIYSVNQQIVKNVMANKRASVVQETGGTHTSKIASEGLLMKQAYMNGPENKVRGRMQSKSKYYSGKIEHMLANQAQNMTQHVININNYEFDTDPTTDNSYIDIKGVMPNQIALNKEKVFDNDVSDLSEVSMFTSRQFASHGEH